MSERVTGLLYLEHRGRRISIPSALRAEMVQCAKGICHQLSCRWSRGPGRAFDPTTWENKTHFSVGSWMIFTLQSDSLQLLSSSPHIIIVVWSHFHSVPVGPSLCSKDNNGFPCRKGKQDYGFSIRGNSEKHARLWGSKMPHSHKAYISTLSKKFFFQNPSQLIQRWPAVDWTYFWAKALC